MKTSPSVTVEVSNGKCCFVQVTSKDGTYSANWPCKRGDEPSRATVLGLWEKKPGLFKFDPAKEWYRAEAETCRVLGMKHLGGNRPGPDCVGDGAVVDVKHYQRNVGSRSVEKSIQSRQRWPEEGRHIIASTHSDFTEGARRAARDNGVELLRIGKEKDGRQHIDHVQPLSTK